MAGNEHETCHGRAFLAGLFDILQDMLLYISFTLVDGSLDSIYPPVMLDKGIRPALRDLPPSLNARNSKRGNRPG